MLTLVNVGILAFDPGGSSLAHVLVGTTIAIGGVAGVLVGTMLELRRTSRRLSQSNDVLNRILQHNLRNDLTVMLGTLGELDREVSGRASQRVDRLQSTVDNILGTVEKTRQFDVALAADHRSQEPVDLVPQLRERIEGVRTAHPEADVQADLPEEAWVYADWLVGTVLDNVVENVVVHADDEVRLRVSVATSGNTVAVRISDNCPTIPENERAVFDESAETPLRHSQGVGLWLVRFVMESYGGAVDVETDGTADAEGRGNTIVLRFRAAPAAGARGWLPDLG